MPQTTETVPCYDCGQVFERPVKGPRSIRCRTCRKQRKHVLDVARRQKHRRSAETIRLALPREAGVYTVEELANQLDQFDRSMFSPDRQPAGTTSTRGSDDGRSTNFEDLRNVLDAREAESANHPWWSENPHWYVNL